jgi:hypothetical protein
MHLWLRTVFIKKWQISLKIGYLALVFYRSLLRRLQIATFLYRRKFTDFLKPISTYLKKNWDPIKCHFLLVFFGPLTLISVPIGKHENNTEKFLHYRYFPFRTILLIQIQLLDIENTKKAKTRLHLLNISGWNDFYKKGKIYILNKNFYFKYLPVNILSL